MKLTFNKRFIKALGEIGDMWAGFVTAFFIAFFAGLFVNLPFALALGGLAVLIEIIIKKKLRSLAIVIGGVLGILIYGGVVWTIIILLTW